MSSSKLRFWASCAPIGSETAARSRAWRSDSEAWTNPGVRIAAAAASRRWKARTSSSRYGARIRTETGRLSGRLRWSWKARESRSRRGSGPGADRAGDARHEGLQAQSVGELRPERKHSRHSEQHRSVDHAIASGDNPRRLT